jgi:hypothetical protein
MIKRLLPLMLMLAWAPTVLAFPPCKPSGSPLELLPLGSAFSEALWFRAEYAMVGNQSIVDELKASSTPATGKCGDRVPVPTSNISTGIIQLSPRYSPISGYGVVSLPELPYVAIHGLNVQYKLDFTIDNAPLVNAGDWIDLAQLDFVRDRKDIGSKWQLSTVYRVRKIQRRTGTMVQVIESRAINDGSYTGNPTSIDSIIAEIPLTGANGATPIALRWTQRAQTPSDAEVPVAPIYSVAATMEVLDLGKETTGKANHMLFSTALSRQWADALSMGLLDYNVPNTSAYNTAYFRVESADVFLSANTL